MTLDRELLAERVLRAVDLVPPGRVVSYGDIAGIVGIGARQVGMIMSRGSGGSPWWRVTTAAGDYPVQHATEARRRWAAEGIELRPDGRGCRIATYRTDLHDLARRWEVAVADLLTTEQGGAPGVDGRLDDLP